MREPRPYERPAVVRRESLGAVLVFDTLTSDAPTPDTIPG